MVILEIYIVTLLASDGSDIQSTSMVVYETNFFLMLIALISGPKQLRNDLDIYLASLVDDFKKL